MDIAYLHFRDIVLTDEMLIWYKALLSQLSNSISDTITANDMRNKLNRILVDDHYHIFFAIDADRIVGSCTLLLEETFLHDCSLNAHIENMVVDRQYRWQGIASVLLQMCIAHARQAGAYKIILDCVPQIQDVYIKNGFEMKAVQMRMDLDHL
jgi:glucosamine-phosphate N-acetyltransferase